MLGGSAKNEKNLGGFPCIRVCPFKANTWQPWLGLLLKWSNLRWVKLAFNSELIPMLPR